MNYWPLLGIALVVLGFALKLNPMLVVTAAAIATGLLAGMDIVEVSPPYDHAETTAMAANRAALEAISALAVRRRDGKRVRFRVAAPGACRPDHGVLPG